MTCTPYGINTHRLLVRGHRIENEAAASVVRVPADAMQIEPVTVAPLVAVPVLILLFMGLLFMTRRRKSVRKKSRKGKKQETIEGGIQNEDT